MSLRFELNVWHFSESKVSPVFVFPNFTTTEGLLLFGDDFGGDGHFIDLKFFISGQHKIMVMIKIILDNNKNKNK